MKLFRLKTIVVVSSLLLIIVPASAEEILTNRSVERMVAAGLSPDVVRAKIKGTKSNFDVSIDEILDLKERGVPDDIIKAMVDAAANKNIAPPRNDYDQGGQYHEPGQRYEPNTNYSGAYRPQVKADPIAKLTSDINEAQTLKDKRDYSWKGKAHAIAVALKTIYPSNTHNIKYWWAYTQYSVLVEKEHHILKGIKKVLYFDGYHEDALILKGDTSFTAAKEMRPGDDSGGFSQEDMADDAKKAYRTALEIPKLSAAKKSKVYYQLGEIGKEIGKSKTRAKKYWQKAMDEDPKGHWGLLAADRLGLVPEENSEQYQPPLQKQQSLQEQHP
ncbi:MAG: hypothetical protein ABFS09_09105 [Thermodesulfobacteriota bacterium]